MNLSPNLPSITLPLHSLPCPIQPYHSQPPSIPLLTTTNPPSTITVTLQLPISYSTTTYSTITLPSTMSHSPYYCSTHHIETLTNDLYTISNLPYSHIPLHGPSLTKSVLDALTSLCTALASAVYTLCHLPHKSHDYPHFNIYISFGGPKYYITALNTYVILLLHLILTT
ncbi:CDG_1a_G0034520.mRNA.1.CDS.1 [Saccharomyces cerevisiae]|nr:CDG_1a_G0034520.mRNA.1.CDS.1 [Saccharomyces cerevisiae]CAI7397708.1 CDG_1a_G0034520.mRNA.1.CDS.1 [Saccharomyces cerevisiae]